MKKSILFVDDEQNIVQGLRRMFHSMRNVWTMYFASSGEEALEILSKNQIDVVVSDMRMPNMDGAELLSRVQNKYPQTVRIILSGHSDEEMILRATKSTHQFISKPCNAGILKDAIDRACTLRDLLKNEKVVRIATGIGELPSLPGLYHKLLTEVGSESSSIKKIGDIISQDMAMTAKILQFVNSAFFGLPQHISNPHQAVSLLGINLIKSLIISVGIFNDIKIQDDSIFTLESLWEHSMMVGILSSKIIKNEMNNQEKTDDAMIAGLLHDIGKLLLIRLEDYSKKIHNSVVEEGIPMYEAENKYFEITHAEVGAYLLGLWGLPNSIIEPVAFHHNPSSISHNDFSILTAVHVSNAYFTDIDKYPDISLSPLIDMAYLKNINVDNKLSLWHEYYIELKNRGITYEA
jgi:putative nucleotidyltransferase with HDIG domain